MVSDRVGDFIVRLKNAAAAHRAQATAPYSAHLEAIARKLYQLGYVGKVSTDGEGAKQTLVVELMYDTQGGARIRGVKRLSKPGRRSYIGHTDAHRVKGGVGARLISTSKGVLSDAEARKARSGGETLFEIW